MSKLLIQNASIADSTRVFTGDVLAVDGVIREIGTALEGAGARVLDASGAYLLPGGVDPHTHFDLDVGFDRASDDFLTGSAAAAYGGTTAVIDHMAFGPAGCSLLHQAEVYRRLAKDAVIDYGFHGVIQHVDAQALADMDALCEAGITSIKAYLTYEYKTGDEDMMRLFACASEIGAIVCVHCENDGAIRYLREYHLSRGEKTPRFHAKSRPCACEAEAVYRMLALSRMAGDAPLYIVHLSTALGLAAVEQARRLGQQNVYAETCPQYLFLDESKYEDDREGLKYIMSPPLRPAGNPASLWGGIASFQIDTVGTDHCPFFFETQKQRGRDDFSLCPNGAPGVETRMRLMFSAAMSGRISLPDAVRLCCRNPAEIFGAAGKGDIAPGFDADLVLWDPGVRKKITRADLHERVDYTPYEGVETVGAPVLTISRGEIIVRDGKFIGKPGRGKFLRRNRRPLRQV